jgi:hypothetical protein
MIKLRLIIYIGWTRIMTEKVVERVFIALLDKMPIERYSEKAVSADELILDKSRLYKIGQIVQATNPIIIDENSIIESEQFNEAYDIIAEALIGACIETKKQRVADKRMSSDDPIPRRPYAIPLIIRKLCYYLVYKAYALTYGYNYNGVYDTLHFNGYQTRILSKIQQSAKVIGITSLWLFAR